MALSDFNPIPGAFTPGANIGADQLEAFRQNDLLFERLIRGLLASPFVPSGFDGEVTEPAPDQILFARSIVLNSNITLPIGLPLIWFARDHIHIQGEIDGKGKGAPSNSAGDLGGSGGGGNDNLLLGGDCKIPGTNHKILNGAGATTIGQSLTEPQQRQWVPRLFSLLGLCQGGAGGGGTNGGSGGGIVFLCAPNIVISGKIDVSGNNGGANSGGGGGGAILLRGLHFTIPNEASSLIFRGGAAGTGGARGGDGFVFKSLVTI